MCGIIAIVRRRSGRQVPETTEIADLIAGAARMLSENTASLDAGALEQAAQALSEADRLLRGEPGLQAMLTHAGLIATITNLLGTVTHALDQVEAALDARGADVANPERLNAALIAIKDAAWSIERDRLRTARDVADLVGPGPSGAAVAAGLSIQQALSSLDRLEVRGRDSAGVHVLVRDHGLDFSDPVIAAMIAERSNDSLFMNGSVRNPAGLLGFVYKAAAEIGELGDNTRHMRESIANDELLRAALANEDAQAAVLGHTRWASVGIISEPNAHPVNSEELGRPDAPYVTATLNGDVDNFADLVALEQLMIAGEITTDAKVIPTLVSRGLASGLDLDEAVRSSVTQFEGSVAIGLSSTESPEDIHLALRGSGQGVYIGLAEDAFVVASEPYGIVEDSVSYLRMDGETPADLDNPAATQGQIVRLFGNRAGQIDGLVRYSYDGVELPVDHSEWKDPEVTTRDIDRGDAAHFLLKEISESPQSFAKTLRGRIVEDAGILRVKLPAETVSDATAAVLGSGRIRRVEVIGQGTAAVAGLAVARAFESAIAPEAGVSVRAITATELSGFELREDMSDTLVIAISQSGTTTDTNRTVDLLHQRGATVLAIVNRRGSDLVDKSDGVLYTSDGRDVEMSVASTKAFYAQIAAGFLLADGVAELLGHSAQSDEQRHELLSALRELPDAMAKVLTKRADIAAAAERHAPSRRYWAMVGNGDNAVAARELRIKLSELCYKSIACDITEDKKHIDLSSEPLILVCASGLEGSNADDVAKEVAIFRAHKAAPIVIATEGENRFNGALEVITVPATHQQLAFVLSTVVGHLFGYEAALAIDASARSLREARALIERYVGAADDRWFEQFAVELEAPAASFYAALREGRYNGQLEASTATRLASLLRFASRTYPLEAYQIEFGKVGTPGVVVEDLNMALTAAIEELTRPIDAIKHQAKTVTVGISRADESLLQSDLIQAVLATGCPRDRLSYRTLRSLAALDPAIESVTGYTRYRVEAVASAQPQIYVLDRGGLAAQLSSRVANDPTLRGTKHRVAADRELIVTVGSDDRIVLIVPEVKDGQTTGLTLCHLTLREDLDVATARSVLQGYHKRYRQLVDVVTESEPSFREDLLAGVPTVELLTAPISTVAARWVADRS